MNNPLRNFSLMLEAMAELQPEIDAALRQDSDLPRPVPPAPSLAESLSELGPLPKEAMLLGLASDGLPVLLNLHDPHPGPLLVAADPGTCVRCPCCWCDPLALIEVRTATDEDGRCL